MKNEEIFFSFHRKQKIHIYKYINGHHKNWEKNSKNLKYTFKKFNLFTKIKVRF